MSGDDLLQPLETIVDGRLIQGYAGKKGKRREEHQNNVFFEGLVGNKLIEKSLRIRVNSFG